MTIFLYLLLPLLTIAGIYRLLAHLTSVRRTRHGIVPPDEEERKQGRIFRDEES